MGLLATLRFTLLLRLTRAQESTHDGCSQIEPEPWEMRGCNAVIPRALTGRFRAGPLPMEDCENDIG